MRSEQVEIRELLTEVGDANTAKIGRRVVTIERKDMKKQLSDGQA